MHEHICNKHKLIFEIKIIKRFEISIHRFKLKVTKNQFSSRLCDDDEHVHRSRCKKRAGNSNPLRD